MLRPWSIVRAAALGVLLLALAACPRPTRKTLVPQVPTSGDATARQRFLAARDAFVQGGGQVDEFRAIADDYHGDPVERFALLYAGIAAQQGGEAAGAVASLQALLALPDLEPGIRSRGELYLGMASSYLGDGETALPLLARSEAAIESPAERDLWMAAQVHAHLASATPLAALPWMARVWASAGAAERGYLLARGSEAVTAVDAAAAQAAWDQAGENRVAVALLAERVAADHAAAGDGEGAAKIRSRGAAALAALDLPPLADGATPTEAGPPIAVRFGAVIAQSAKHARIGEQIVKGLHVGASSVGAAAPTIEIVDAEGAAAGAAVTTLAATDALAIVGPADGASVDAAATSAAERSIPMVSLSPRAEERASGRWTFHIVHSAEARARSLAQRAHAAGVRRFAVLRPENGYGTAVTKAFTAEVAALGDELVIEVTYKADSKSFAGVAKKLAGNWQAVFIPDSADKVELAAPALAAAGFIARPFGAKKVPSGRPVVLLSTVEGAGADYVREAGRYSAGALLAPGYFPGAVDDRGLEFERLYLAATGKPPTAVDAYAFDSVRMLVALIAAGARTRDELAQRLGQAAIDGVTGAIRFDRDHRRSDDGVIYTVEVDGTAATVRVAP